ncbi:hypothetical protein [Agathobaculum sp. Marseille-P7918]|uniref:hypothetical protein n=1 Tax=Agathobaculum sp. Marseille-P7918 TaxID=2479843 RepID=UPI00356416F8
MKYRFFSLDQVLYSPLFDFSKSYQSTKRTDRSTRPTRLGDMDFAPAHRIIWRTTFCNYATFAKAMRLRPWRRHVLTSRLCRPTCVTQCWSENSPNAAQQVEHNQALLDCVRNNPMLQGITRQLGRMKEMLSGELALMACTAELTLKRRSGRPCG